ncbi:hypothetical protein ILUMI_00438, partial [Ignelater luminosus]
ILYTELKDKNQYFACKSQELASAKNKLQILQEDIFLIKLELESMKSKPLDACSKGNSLFAEVEDSCQKVQQSLEQTKKNYNRLKQDFTTKMKQLSIMRNQNIELSTKLNMVDGSNEDYDKIIEKYKAEVCAWESVIEQHKKQTSEQPKLHGNDLQQYAIEFANNTLKSKWASEKKLLETLNNESKKKLETCIEIESVNNEMRRWRRIAQQLKVKTEKLENFISEIELYNNLGETNDLEECYNIIEQELCQIDSNVNVAIDDILKCGITIEQKSPSIENDISTDTICNELFKLSSVVVKPDNSLENFQDQSNLTNITEIEDTFAEKLTIKDDEIKDEYVDVSSYHVQVKSEVDDEESNISSKLENKFFETIETDNNCKVEHEGFEPDVQEVDSSIQNESIIEIESTFNESNTEEQSLVLVKVENQSTIEDSSVEIVGEFPHEEIIKFTQYDENVCAIKNENVDDNNVEDTAEYEHPQNGNSLNNVEVLQYDENSSEQRKEENNSNTVDYINANVEIPMEPMDSQRETLMNHMESNQSSKENPSNNFESNNIRTEIKLTNLQKQNLSEQAMQSARSYSTPVVKSANGIKSGSESKINNNGVPSHSKLQKQNSLSSIKTKQCAKTYSTPAVHHKCATAVKSVPNAVLARKYVSQSDKKVIKSSTATNIPVPARKKLL